VGGVSQAHGLFSRAALAGRRVTAAPDWPLVAGAVLGLLAIVEVTTRNADRFTGDDGTTPLLLALFATAPVVLVRSRLTLAAVVITAATLFTQVSGNPLTMAGVVAQVTVLYLVGLRRSRRVSLTLVALFAVYAVLPVGDAPGRRLAMVLLGLAAVAAAIGIAGRMRREAAERHASRQTIAEALLENAARGERARIARELHDVVAHHISMIAVQAETARLTTPGMPAEGAKRLVAIGDTARDALTEMRRLLGVLREDAGAAPTRRPQPGLEQLNDLIDDARDSAGASTRLILRGHVVPVDPGVALTAYRIVQEALTNARRHAPGSAVDVELDYAPAVLYVRIRDNGPGPAAGGPAATGHGLLGMRERAAMVGGTVRAGPGRLGGFLVEAALPVATVDGPA
jgi:signal transduction histidine kinase